LALVPHKRHWIALEKTDKEKGATGYDGRHHGSVDDVCVQLSDTNSQKEATDGKFREDHDKGIEEITEVPVKPW